MEENSSHEHPHAHHVTHVTKSSKDYSPLYTPIAIVMAGGLMALGVFFGLSGQLRGGAAAAGPVAPANVNIKDVKLADAPMIGSPDAPLSMAFWFDYQCPYCKATEVGGIPQIPTKPSIPVIFEKYVKTGKLKIYYKDFAFLGNDSIAGAEYGHAVWTLYPDKWYAWHTAMMKAQDEEGDRGFGNASTIETLIQKMGGMDVAKIKSYIAQNKDKLDALIKADTAEGQSMGIQGTPGSIIGTKLVDGAQSPEAFSAAIDAQL